MPFYFEPGGTDRYTLEDFEPSFGTKMSAAVKEAWKESYLGVGVDLFRASTADGPKLSFEEMNSYIEQSGVKLSLAPRDTMSRAQLDVLIDRQKELDTVKDIRARTPWDWGSPVRGLAMFGVGVADPVNLATAFVPWTKVLPAMRTLEAARLSSSALTRFAGRVGTGAIDGGLTTAALEPFYAGVRTQLLGDDYTAVDSMANIAFGTAFGGGVLGIGGVGVDAFRRAMGRTAPSERFRGLNVKDIEQVVEFETRLQKGDLDVQGIRDRLAGFSTEMRRAAGFDDVRTAALNQPANPLHNRVVESNGRVTVSGAAGRIEARVVNDTLTITEQNLIPVLRASEYGQAMVERLVNYAQDRGVTVTTGNKVSKAAADAIQALEQKGFIVGRREGTTVDSNGNLVNKTGPVFEISEGPMYTRATDDAQAIIERIDPETRNAAFQAGTAQMVEGFPVDVDAIINTDETLGAAITQEELEARAANNRRPENLRAADFNASEKIDAENAAAPKWEALEDAEAAMAEADAMLNDTIQAGDQAFKYSRAQGGPDKPGVGVEAGNKLGFEPDLRVKAKLGRTKLPEKPLILTGTNNKNAPKQIAALDQILDKFPNAGDNAEEWSKMMAYAFASDEVPIPPYAFLRDVNTDNATTKLRQLTAGQIADADHGFENAAAFRAAYVGKELDVVTTGKLFMWSFLSRGVSPYVQESLFIDAFPGVDEWIRKAAAGELTEADFPAYEAWAKSVAPAGSGQPGAGATHNLNAFGKSFLFKMGAKDETGVSHLQRLHDMMENPNITGKEIRREFAKFGEGVGIDNKVVSFTLLVAGFDDVMVLDRVQIRQLWDDGRFSGKNLYDGRMEEGKRVAGSSLAELTMGARGLLIYEAIERTLSKKIDDIYTALGRKESASIGRYHWESWVADSQQEASHGTLGAILPDAKGDDMAIARVTAKQGEYGAYEYGAMYGRDADGTPYFVYNTPDGQSFEFTVPAFREFLTEIKKPGAGVVPGKFKVTESGNAPWFTRNEVNQARLSEVAAKWADRQGGTGEGARLVQAALEGQESASGLGARYSRGISDGGLTPGVRLTEEIRKSFGDDTQALLEAGNIRIVNTPADIPGGPHPADVKAATAPDGTVYVVAENVDSAQIKGLMLHEVGVHVGMEKMLGSELFNDVLSQVDQAIARGESWAQAARDAVPADTPMNLVREEQLAYLVENSPELPLVQRIIAAVRAWVFQNFKFAQERMTLTEADFRSLAASALRFAARTEPVSPRMGIGRMVSAFARSVDQIESKSFRDWFGDSKVVDADGKPLVLYHGTGASFDVFDPDAFIIGAFFTDNSALANMYANGTVENIMPVYLRIQNPMIVDAKGKVWSRLDNSVTVDGKPLGDVIDLGKQKAGQVTTEILAAFAKLKGYDGVIFKQILDVGPSAKYLTDAAYDPSDVYVAFDQTSIKSAIGNRGSFDPANPDIRYSRGETPDPTQPDAELRSADQALARAKSFAGVLRAAADKLEDDAAAVAAMRQQLPDITEQEIDMLLKGLKQQVKGLRNVSRSVRDSLAAGNTVVELQSQAMHAADVFANNLQMAASIERRNAALNSAARLKASAFVNQFKDKGLDFEGFAALLVGTERVREGGRVSIDAEHKGFRAEFVGGLVADMEKLGMMREFISGTFDRDIYDALWRMGQDKPDFTGLPEMSVKMAEVINKYQTAARNRRNRFGAWIRDLQGYITRQSHDMYKIRDASETDWVNFVRDRLDVAKMMRMGILDQADPMMSLRNLYQDFASGTHMKPRALEEDTVAFSGGANLARKESQSRALYFKDGIAAYEYNQRFGSGTLAESVVTGLDRSASSAALLKTLGTNPENTLNKLMDEYEDSLVGERRNSFRQKRGAILNLLKQVDGSVNIPGSVTAAKVGAFLRAWQSMAKLGGALISSFSDLAGYAAELRYQQDKNLFSGVADGIGALLKGRAKGEQADILTSLGVFHESVASSISARFDSPELVSGKMSAAMNAFFRLNGLTWWTETLRDGAALSHSAYLANNVSKSFDQLDSNLQRLLGLYKIDAAKWELMRMAKTVSADGKIYMTPDSLRTVPRSAYEAYITSIGRTVNDASVQNLMDDLAQTMRTMFIDRAHHAVLEPNARARAFMLRGNPPGTLAGELLRYITQFKSFSIAMTQMVLGREVYGRGYDTVGEYLRKGRGDMLGLATMIGMYGVLGYASMAIKDLIKGREPRDPLDPKTVTAALAQGGGLGLYGDFLFGEYNRMGRSFTSSLAGPTLGNLDALTDLWTRLRNGDDTAAAAFKTLISNTPFLNLFWIRPLLDYLVLFRIQESLNPGYLRRMESRIERENNQQFLLRPSEVVR